MSTRPDPSNRDAYLGWLEEKIRVEAESQPLTWICWFCLGICLGDMTTQARRELRMRGEWKRPAVTTYFAIRFFSLMAFVSAVVWSTTGGTSDLQASVWSKLFVIFETLARGAIFAVLLLRTLTLYQGRFQRRVRIICVTAWFCVSLFGLVNCFTYRSYASPLELGIASSATPRYGLLRIVPYILSFLFCLAMTILTAVAVRKQMQRIEDVSTMSGGQQRAVATPVITRILQHQLIYLVVLTITFALIGGLQSVEEIPGYYAFVPNALVLVIQATLACNMILSMRFPTLNPPRVEPTSLLHIRSCGTSPRTPPAAASPLQRDFQSAGYRYAIEQIRLHSPLSVEVSNAGPQEELKQLHSMDSIH